MEARFSAPVQVGPGSNPTSYTMGTGSFPGIRRPGRGVEHAPPSSAEVKKRVELDLYSPFGPLWSVLEWTLSLQLHSHEIKHNINSSNACHHSVQNILPFGLQSATANIIINDLLLRAENCFLTHAELYRLRTFKNSVLRKMFENMRKKVPNKITVTIY